MKSLLKALVLPLVFLAATSIPAAAQVKIQPGSYELLPDSNYSAGFDVSGLVVEFTATSMSAIQQGNLLVKSVIKINGDVLTLTDVEGQVACPSEAKYKFSSSPKGFRLTPVEDACAERSAVLAQVTFVKKA